jgi:HTH-type transcriptional regulator/antitoxin HigA
MLNTQGFKQACRKFTATAGPYLFIKDEAHYQQALILIESLLEEAQDSPSDPINAVTDLLSQAIEVYENKDKDLVDFAAKAAGQPPDLAMLRLLMDQYQLATADLPEIGSKSMVSRVLSGERSLSKKQAYSGFITTFSD